MSVAECCIKSCENKKVPESKVSFHYMRFDWTLELQDKNAIKDGIQKKLICSKHFKPELVIERNGREFLVPNAVPTLHLLNKPEIEKIPSVSKKIEQKEVVKEKKVVKEPVVQRKNSIEEKYQLRKCSVKWKNIILKCAGPKCNVINENHTFVAQIINSSGRHRYVLLCKRHRDVSKPDTLFHLSHNGVVVSLSKAPIPVDDSDSDEIEKEAAKEPESEKKLQESKKKPQETQESTKKRKIVEKEEPKKTRQTRSNKSLAEKESENETSGSERSKTPSQIWRTIFKPAASKKRKRDRPPSRATSSASETMSHNDNPPSPEPEKEKPAKKDDDPNVICLDDSDEEPLKMPKLEETCCIPGCKSGKPHSVIMVGEAPNFEHLVVCLHHRDCFKNIHAMEPVPSTSSTLNNYMMTKHSEYILEEGEVPPSPPTPPHADSDTENLTEKHYPPPPPITSSPVRGEPIPVQRVRPTVLNSTDSTELNAQGHILVSRKCISMTGPSGTPRSYILEEWGDGSIIYTPAPTGLPLGHCTKEQIAFYKTKQHAPPPPIVPESNQILSARHIIPSPNSSLPIADVSKSELVYIQGKPFLLTSVQNLAKPKNETVPALPKPSRTITAVTRQPVPPKQVISMARQSFPRVASVTSLNFNKFPQQPRVGVIINRPPLVPKPRGRPPLPLNRPFYSGSQSLPINRAEETITADPEPEAILSGPVPIAITRVAAPMSQMPQKPIKMSPARTLPQKKFANNANIHISLVNNNPKPKTPIVAVPKKAPNTPTVSKNMFIVLEKSKKPEPQAKAGPSREKTPPPTVRVTRQSTQASPSPKKIPTIMKTLNLSSDVTLRKIPTDDEFSLPVTEINAFDDDSDSDDFFPAKDLVNLQFDSDDPEDPLSTNAVSLVELDEDPLNERPSSSSSNSSNTRRRGSLPFPSSIKKRQ